MAIILIRTLIIFLALIVAMRLMGKRQLGELELSELVVAVLIADIASIPLQNPSLPLSYGLIPLLVLFLHWLFDWNPVQLWVWIVLGVYTLLMFAGSVIYARN